MIAPFLIWFVPIFFFAVVALELVSPTVNAVTSATESTKLLTRRSFIVRPPPSLDERPQPIPTPNGQRCVRVGTLHVPQRKVK